MTMKHISSIRDTIDRRRTIFTLKNNTRPAAAPNPASTRRRRLGACLRSTRVVGCLSHKIIVCFFFSRKPQQKPTEGMNRFRTNKLNTFSCKIILASKRSYKYMKRRDIRLDYIKLHNILVLITSRARLYYGRRDPLIFTLGVYRDAS